MLGLGYAAQNVRVAFFDWLSGDALQRRIEAAFLSDGLGKADLMTLDHALTTLPTFDIATLPVHRKGTDAADA